MKTITIRERDEYIELQSLLKKINVISTGGEAKIYLQVNDVYVNSIKEERRGRKLYPKDIVKLQNEEYMIVKP